MSSTGEASAPEDYHWLVARAGYKPVMEYCGGTEIGERFPVRHHVATPGQLIICSQLQGPVQIEAQE